MNKIKKICLFLCFLLSLGTIFYVCFKDLNDRRYNNDYRGLKEKEEESDYQKTIDLEKAIDFNDLSFKLTFFCGCLISFLISLAPLYFFTYPFSKDYLYFSRFLCRKEKKMNDIHPFAKNPEQEELKKKGQLMLFGIVRFLKTFGKIGDDEKKIADLLQRECFLRLTFFFTFFYILIEYSFFPLVFSVIIYFSCRRLAYIFKIGNHHLSFKKVYFMIIDNYLLTGSFLKRFQIFGFLAYGLLLFIFYFGFQWGKSFIIEKEEMNVDWQKYFQYSIKKK